MSSESNFIQINQLNSTRNKISDKYLKGINKTVDKKFYIGMDFHKIFNPDFPQEYYTALFNEIYNQMPHAPALYNWETIPKVFKKFLIMQRVLTFAF